MTGRGIDEWMDDRVSRPHDLAVLPDATSRRRRTGRDCRRVSPTLLLCYALL